MDTEITTTEIKGLTKSEVEERVSKGQVNGKTDLPTKSVGQILSSNFFQLFNLLNLVMVILVCTLGNAPGEAVFAIPAVLNLVLGIVQELRAKRTVEKLSLIHALKVNVLRDGEEKEIAVHEIVLDEVLLLDAGKQICADSVVLEGRCEVNESLLTGESDPVVKEVGDSLMSGSFIISGKVSAKVTAVGMDSYANKISAGARYIKQTNSEIVKSMRAIIRIMSIIVVPLGVLLLLKEVYINDTPFAKSVVSMVASMSSMIPQGLVALISTVFAIGVIRLSRHKTLAQDLYCIETLARVDVLCLDKTGTITEGSMQVNGLVPKNDFSTSDMDEALIALVSLLPDNNPTYNAVREKYEGQTTDMEAVNLVPFSSARKWSGVTTQKGSFIMGAPEFVCREQASVFAEETSGYAQNGDRVLVLVHSAQPIQDEKAPDDIKIMGFILIGDKIRKEAPDTLKYFADQGVDIRIISGDNPLTVSAIAKKAGLEKVDYIDLSTITTDEELIEASRKYKVFGRVTPDQKLKLVKALKADGHTVAMTGDGVNDVLALKEADCSIAMASGSDAARNVAQLVLLDNNFASMPRILAEGRRSINNLTRSSALFLVKTIYATLLTIIFMIPGISYPFSPKNLTLAGMVSIGIPGALLAIEPNKDVVKGRFLSNVMSKAVPGGVSIALAMIILQVINRIVPAGSPENLSTVSVVVLTACAFAVLYRACKPFNLMHTLIFFGNIALFFICWLICQYDLPILGYNFFGMTPIGETTNNMLILMCPLAVVSVILILLSNYAFEKYISTHGLVFINKIEELDKKPTMIDRIQEKISKIKKDKK